MNDYQNQTIKELVEMVYAGACFLKNFPKRWQDPKTIKFTERLTEACSHLSGKMHDSYEQSKEIFK